MVTNMSTPGHAQHFQLREYQVQYNLGQTRIYSIDQINELDEMIRIYGRGIISSIKFLFHNNQHPFYYLILRNTGQNDKFVVEFYHYYNQYIERVEMSREQRQADFNIIMSLLSSTQNLNSRLVSFIINPFYPPVINQNLMT